METKAGRNNRPAYFYMIKKLKRSKLVQNFEEIKLEGRLLQDVFPDSEEANQPDPVNNPEHYTQHPSGIECITITEHMIFNLGNAIKYIWRSEYKGNKIEDLKKAIFYLNREIKRCS